MDTNNILLEPRQVNLLYTYYVKVFSKYLFIIQTVEGLDIYHLNF